jgi:phosphoserine phosphatase
MSIILSDIEGTLTTGSSWRGLRDYYKEHFDPKRYNRFFLSWVPRYTLVSLGLMSRRAAMLDWMHAEIQLFQGLSVDEFEQISEWIVEDNMWPGVRQDVLAELKTHRQAGAQIAVVSSAYQPIVAAFARRMGAVPIGSKLVFADGKINGIRDPINAYEHKANFVRAEFADAPIAATYGDTASDIPMMEMSTEPVAVHPDKELRRVAEARGWRIIDGNATANKHR